tara:strand:- start:325 stop:507 length:183 start_codon:yes stop_codon:yes gene_type:complete
MGCGCNNKKGNRQKSTVRKTVKGSVTPKSSRQVMRQMWNKSEQVNKNTNVKKINKLTPRK